MKKELNREILGNFNTVQHKIVDWIGESISLYREQPIPKQLRIVVLIGPAGVGKTTAVAKLAAMYGIEEPEKQKQTVHIISMDVYNICSKKKLETYGDILDIPVSHVDNKTDLKKEIAKYTKDTDLILVDTIGRIPMKTPEIEMMKEFIDCFGKEAEIHLVIAAHTKTSAIEDFLQEYKNFNYNSVLLTKMDETRFVGDIISILADKGISVSYITDGQNIPKDIKKAERKYFLEKLIGFHADLEKTKNNSINSKIKRHVNKARHALSKIDRENIVRLKRQGWSIDEIGAVFSMSRGEVELVLELEGKD
jgi:flagellar biosynthesis protein FlhF